MQGGGHETLRRDREHGRARRRRGPDGSRSPLGGTNGPPCDRHTISDQLVPVQQENFYAERVAAAGSGGSLRQAYVASVGHCNFSPAELVAGVLALGHRVSTGRWDSLADPGSLDRVASGLGLGPARFVSYHPGALTGAVRWPWPLR